MLSIRSMPKFTICIRLLALLALLAVWSAGASPIAPAWAQQAPLYIEVNAAKLRSQPAHWGPALRDLRYGDRVVELSSDRGWRRVRLSDGQEGFVHDSAVTVRKVVLRSGEMQPDMRPEDSDVVLAGKGFCKDVEDYYATSAQADFAAVDAWEKKNFSDRDLAQFLRAGGLNVEELG